MAAVSSSDTDQTAIRNDMWASGRQFVSSILWNGSGNFDDLLTSQTVYVNARMAKLYPDAVPAAAPADDNTFVAATWPASEGRSGLLTQPSYLWAQSDPALNSIVKRGKQLHDDVLCQDTIGPPIDLSTAGAQNALNCKSMDGTQTLSTCDSEVLKADARLSVRALPGLPRADRSLRAGSSELRPHRQLSNGGRGGATRSIRSRPSFPRSPRSRLAQASTRCRKFSPSRGRRWGDGR